MNQIIMQAIYYSIVMIITFVLMDFMTQGFIHKFIKVFGSLGRLSFVKIRHSTYDGIAIGREEEGFLIFNYKKSPYRISLDSAHKNFYRFLFCQWIDVDGEKWAICRCDYSVVSGYDPVKFESFLKRVMMAPKEDDQMMKVIMFLCIGILIGEIVIIVFNFTAMQKADQILKVIEVIKQSQAAVTGVNVP